MPVTEWDHYLTAYHSARPGITETALEHARDPAVGTAYDWLVRALPAHLGDVLDIASGNAALQPVLPAHDTYLGVDLSEAELAHGRSLGRGPVVSGDARALPVPDGAVDTVVSSMGLMLVRPLARAVEEIARVLRPGGTAAILLPAIRPVQPKDLPGLLALSWPLRGPGAMPQRVTARAITGHLNRAGLTCVEIRTHRFAFPLRTHAHARLAVQSLYTPGRTAAQLLAAEAALVRRLGARSELPVPLMRVIARRP